MAATDIVTLDEAKEQLNIDLANIASDGELAGFISGASKVAERYAGAVVHRTVTETFDGGRDTVLLSTLPVVSVTAVSDSGAVLESGGYAVSAAGVLTRVAGVAPLPFLAGYQSVTVTYVAGRVASTALVASAAPDIRLATLIILQHMWETQRPAASGPFSQRTDDYDPRYAYSVPRRAQELLGVEMGEQVGFA